MNRQGRVLIVDDLESWRKALTVTLQREGFHTDSAFTAAEVLERLQETLYHMVILDIRLVDSDPSNTEGIDLLRELDQRGLSRATAIIILSAYGTLEHMRRAFKDYEVADFLEKDKFNPQVFLESVKQVFAQKVKINLALDIQWQQVKRPEEVISNLEIGGIRLKRNPALQDRIALELDDLLCRLFFEATSVLVRPLAIGQSSTGVLWVQPFLANGGGRAVIVKFGDFDKIQEEYSNFKQYVQPFVGGGRNPTVLELRRTPQLGGIIYSLLGATGDHLKDFGNYYQRSSIL